MNPPWHYRAYDLHIASDFELPELCAWPGATADAPDVTIILGAMLEGEKLEEAHRAEQELKWGERQSCLYFQIARFTVSDGNHVLVEPVEGYGPAAWRVPLLGSVLAALLEQRGLFALHAGALIFDNGAAAFLGDKGQGKSTLNAALSHAGFPLLNDDVTALQMPEGATGEAKGAPCALPGFSQVKLRPDAVRAATGTDPDQWHFVAPEIAELDKRAFQAPLAQTSAPLRALFVLHSAPDEAVPDEAATGTAQTIADSAENGLRLRRLSAQEALAQLIPHTFGARFGAGYLEGTRRKAHFLDCARLVNLCPVWELTRPRDLALLPATIDLIARVMAEDATV